MSCVTTYPTSSPPDSDRKPKSHVVVATVVFGGVSEVMTGTVGISTLTYGLSVSLTMLVESVHIGYY